jgi:hypothetical protein
MNESDFYIWFLERLTAIDISANRTVDRDLILYLVGICGLEILVNYGYLIPTVNPHVYKLR